MAEEAPSALTAACPDCGEETLHSVLRGTMGTRGAFVTIDATVQCTECDRVHHVTLREPKPVEVPVILSKGHESRKAKVELDADAEVVVGDGLIVDGLNCKVTGTEAHDGRRPEKIVASDIKTLWVKEFEQIVVPFAINLGKKTITKTEIAPPEKSFTVGDELVFGRLRVTIHAIKTEERLVKRGSAEAGDIRRIFAAPTPLGGEKHRPDKRQREQLRTKAERDER